MNNKDIDSDLVMPELQYSCRKIGHPSREDEYEDRALWSLLTI